MDKKITEAQQALKALGLPSAQQNHMASLTLLALVGLGPDDSWKKAQRIRCGVSNGIMTFMAERYQQEYKPNTRETVRRQVLHQFVQAKFALLKSTKNSKTVKEKLEVDTRDSCKYRPLGSDGMN